MEYKMECFTGECAAVLTATSKMALVRKVVEHLEERGNTLHKTKMPGGTYGR